MASCDLYSWSPLVGLLLYSYYITLLIYIKKGWSLYDNNHQDWLWLSSCCFLSKSTTFSMCFSFSLFMEISTSFSIIASLILVSHSNFLSPFLVSSPHNKGSSSWLLLNLQKSVVQLSLPKNMEESHVLPQTHCSSLLPLISHLC